jgi:hypothetical protein
MDSAIRFAKLLGHFGNRQAVDVPKLKGVAILRFHAGQGNLHGTLSFLAGDGSTGRAACVRHQVDNGPQRALARRSGFSYAVVFPATLFPTKPLEVIEQPLARDGKEPAIKGIRPSVVKFLNRSKDFNVNVLNYVFRFDPALQVLRDLARQKALEFTVPGKQQSHQRILVSADSLTQ